VASAKVDDTVFYTYGNYESALHTLLEGSLLAVLVVSCVPAQLARDADFRRGLPLSAVPTFWVMDLLGFSLNLVSLPGHHAGHRHSGGRCDRGGRKHRPTHPHGQIPYRASIDAADEIGLAVIATTFTIIAVFVPVSFMGGIPGQYFRQFG
jgi:multidrug efflux pump subunit AcrB